MKEYEVIIVGGSYAGLSAGMALGRALRNVLIIDSGEPCNRQTPHSHNLLTHDGETPAAIASEAKAQVLEYATVEFVKARAHAGRKVNDRFEIDTENETYSAKKLLFATGMKDIMPNIPGFAECWGISVLHCPYCHGYEVKHMATGIIANGDWAYEFAKLINHWTKDLTVFTNGQSLLTPAQRKKIESHQIRIIESEIQKIEHDNGYISSVQLKDGPKIPLKAIYARPTLVQHCPIPQELGCEVSEQNILKVDALQRTTVAGLYAAGDNSIMMRALSLSIAAGGMAGAAINKELIEESF
jgi:thioredoxin reductase